MNITKFLLIGLLGTSAFITGCTKDPIKNLTPEESRIYITSYDSSADFSAFKTFSIADSVGVIGSGHSSREFTPADQAYIDAIKKYMQQNGYVLVEKNQNPDIGINV